MDTIDNIERDHVAKIPAGHTGPRVVIIAVFNDTYAPLAAIARPNWKAYAEKHGYAVVFYPRGFHLDPSRPETYGDKSRFLYYYDVRGHADIVMYLDIDSLFVWHEPHGIERKLGQRSFLWTYDDNGPVSTMWIARTDPKTEKALRFAYERAAIENNVRRGKIEPNGISDQDSMTRLMTVPPFSDTFNNCQEGRWHGLVYDQDESDEIAWVITFPGLPLEKKLERMTHYAELTRQRTVHTPR